MPGRRSGEPETPALWLCAFVAVLPVLIVLLLITALFDAGPQQFLPIWTDEVVYWNEAAVFRAAGFDGGYIAVHEEPARAAFSRFGPHGPLFAMFHGAVGLVFGWRPSSAFAINVVVVSLAAFMWLRGNGRRITAGAVLIVAGFWPLLLYLPTNMQEPTHFALAFLFALVIARQEDSAGGVWHPTLTVILLVAASLLRPSWAFLLLPLAWPLARRTGTRLAVVAVLASTFAAGAIAYAVFDSMASPGYQNSLHRLSQSWAESPERGLGALAETVTTNVRKFVELREGRPPEIVFRYFTALFVAVLAWRSLRQRPREPRRAEASEVALLSVVPVLLVVLLFGEVESWRDFRVISPAVLVGLLLLVRHGSWEPWLWGGTLLFLPFCYQGFVEFHQERFTASHRTLDEMRHAVADRVRFVPGASPWVNTLLVHAELLQFPLLGLPEGVAISYATDWDNVASPIKSEYLLLRPVDREHLQHRVSLVPLASTPLGVLYRNQGEAGASGGR